MEIWCIQLDIWIFCLVHVRLLVTMIVKYNLVEELLELCVRLMTARIHSNARVDILTSREDRLLERELVVVLLVFVLLPNFAR